MPNLCLWCVRGPSPQTSRVAAGAKCCSQETQLTLRSLLGTRECVSHITITGHGDDNGGDSSPSLLLMVQGANFKPSITILAAAGALFGPFGWNCVTQGEGSKLDYRWVNKTWHLPPSARVNPIMLSHDQPGPQGPPVMASVCLIWTFGSFWSILPSTRSVWQLFIWSAINHVNCIISGS